MATWNSAILTISVTPVNDWNRLSPGSLRSKAGTTEIGSDPVAVCFCEDGIFDNDCLNTSRSITVKRGEMFSISLIAVGQLNIPVPASILANSDADRGRVQLYPQFPETDGTCIDVGVKVMSEQESTSRTLYLYPDGPWKHCSDKSVHPDLPGRLSLRV